MDKLHQMVSFKGLVKLILLFVVSMSLSASAMAQSADAAISVARQWLTLADTDQAGQMWEQSSTLMKSQSDRNTWIGYIGDMHTQLGRSLDARVWQAMEHQIDHPDLPRGEFVSVTFVSGYAKARAWEKVALVWQDERWVPVGYQYGPIEAAAK
ncbi:Protein of unknown function [Collimonas sp. OK307]|uniref:DUF4019 domain-containing protein n=1 Tax=Collimonas sp. OK307 TaxID=1801620 RepID=UPI0008F1A2D1|nr:DUF4019 domain-containing protein [Collimonas sp. OK307]SFI44936.1 Protein of unknown function [Collimonas sp. OK307]